MVQGLHFMLFSVFACLVSTNPYQTHLSHNEIASPYLKNDQQQPNQIKQPAQNFASWNMLNSNSNSFFYPSSATSKPNKIVILQAAEPSRYTTESTSTIASLTVYQLQVSNTPTTTPARYANSQDVILSSPSTTAYSQLMYRVVTPASTVKPTSTTTDADANTKLQLCLQSLQNFAQFQQLGLESLRRSRYQQPRLPFLGKIPNQAQLRICMRQINGS